MIFLLTLLQLKHFVFDFLYQPPWQFRNKGTYGHWGGIVHSGQHAIPTFLLLLLWLTPLAAGIIAVGEFLVHYHIDWAKMNINAKMGWGSDTHNEFWQLLGLDQLLHQLTYIAIIGLVYSV